MNLPSELFTEITECVNIISRDEPREADRRAPRIRLSSHLSVAMWNEPQAPLGVRIRDFSIGGIGLLYNERIGLDEEILIRFPLKDERSTLVLGNVVYWEPLAERLFGIGVQFERLVEESEITRQSTQTLRRQINQVSMMSRFAQGLARTWRIAS